MTGNIGYLYYKDYFACVNYQGKLDSLKNQELIRQKNTAIMGARWEPPAGLASPPMGVQTVALMVTPPGLLVGSGIAHETGINGELKLGIYFDHTTGWPYIPGSSVKGVLRSAFDQPGYIKELLRQIGSGISIPDGKKLVDFTVELKIEIFEGVRNGKPIAMYERDCFLDAHISKAEGCILNDDYITPHRHNDRSKAYLDPFVDPNPIRFLKIEPGVEFNFNFLLHNSQVLPALNIEAKFKHFKQIILDLGIGAKTNVGYGGLKEIPPSTDHPTGS